MICRVFYGVLFAFLNTKRLLKGINSKSKEFAPFGSEFFAFIVDPVFRRKRSDPFQKEKNRSLLVRNLSF